MAKINATNMDQNELEAAQNALADEVAHRFLKHAKAELVTGSDPVVVAVGMQNALVSTISGSVVRTTHLTGMFTDLGIDLATLMSVPVQDTGNIRKKIILRLAIISFFLAGGILGGYVFLKYKYFTFYIPAGILVISIFFDVFRIMLFKIVHRIKIQYSIQISK